MSRQARSARECTAALRRQATPSHGCHTLTNPLPEVDALDSCPHRLLLTPNLMGFRTRLFVVTLGVVLLTLVTVYAYVAQQTRRDATERAKHEMAVRLALVEGQLAGDTVPFDNLEHWDEVADRLGSAGEARITLIRKDGTVIGDSEVDLTELAEVENHGQRPEVLGALEEGLGLNRRQSTTVGHEMLYVAKPWQRNGEVVGTLRISLDLDQVASTSANMVRQLTLAALLGLTVAFFGSSLMAHLISDNARRLTAVAQSMAAGNLDVRGSVSGKGEFATLAETLNGLASNLSKTLGELRDERDRLIRVLGSMHEGVLLLDHEGRVQLVNGAAQEMLLLPSQTEGERARDVLSDPELVSRLEAVLADGENSSGEIQLGPSARKVLANVRRLRHRSGALAVLVDITDQRRLETIRQEFVANASHELRTPVTAIVSAVETLQGLGAEDADATKTFIDIIARNALRLGSLVNDLLELSQLESDRFIAECEPIELRRLTEGALLGFIPTARQKNIELVCLVPSQVEVLANAKGLEHVLSNLVQNAINYCPQRSKVTVQSRSTAKGVELSVSDNGPGIAREHLDRLFERFYRVDTGRSRSVGGTGLGLSIVKHWVDAMGGSVRVTSEVGKGTTFFVVLPATRAEAEAPAS